jgi:hypothetical protein
MNIAKHMELIFVAAAIVLCAASYPSNEQVNNTQQVSQMSKTSPAA